MVPFEAVVLTPVKVRRFIRRSPPSKALVPGNFHIISRRAKISPQHVSRVIQGERGCSLEVAARIAYAAGVTLDQLYYWIASNPFRKPHNRHTKAERMAAGLNLHLRKGVRRQTWLDAINKRLNKRLPAPKVVIFP